MEPEVVMNCWVFTQSIGPISVIYELGVRPYVMTGSDDEKTRLLKDLAISDFHFARRFPLPANRYYLKITEKDGVMSASSGDTMEEGKDIRKGLALVRPDISGMHQMEYFAEALDAIEKSFPTRRLGIDGSGTEMPKVNRRNLLSVITNVNVDSNGNQVPRVDDPRRSSPPSAVANLWVFHDEKAKALYAVSGRGYMVHGSDSDKTRVLKALATYDFSMVKVLPATHAVSPDGKYNKDLFHDALHNIEHEIPTAIGIDGKVKNPVTISAIQLMLNATRITERSSNIGDAIPIQLVDAPPANSAKVQTANVSSPTPTTKSFFQRLFDK